MAGVIVFWTRPIETLHPRPAWCMVFVFSQVVNQITFEVHLMTSEVHLITFEGHLMTSEVHLITFEGHLMTSEMHLIASEVHSPMRRKRNAD